MPISNPPSRFTSTDDGLVPASGGGTTTFLRADGSFATPASGAVSSPFVGAQAPGSFTVANGQFALHGFRLTLASTDRGTLAGTARLVISG